MPISMFENIMFWLEKKTLSKTVPTFFDLLNADDVKEGFQRRDLTKIYDHWINRRIQQANENQRIEPLMPMLKCGKSSDSRDIFNKAEKMETRIRRRHLRTRKKIYMKALNFQKCSKIIKQLVIDTKENVQESHRMLSQNFCDFIIKYKRLKSEAFQTAPLDHDCSNNESTKSDCESFYFDDGQYDYDLGVYSFVPLTKGQKYYAVSFTILLYIILQSLQLFLKL